MTISKLCVFDGIKLRVKGQNYFKFLTDNADIFNLKEEQFLTGGSATPIITGSIQGIKITYYKNSDVTVMEFSFHKFSNKNLHNSNQFYWNDFIIAHAKIQELLNLPKRTTLSNLEIGVNVEIPPEWEMTTHDILDAMIFGCRQSKKTGKSVKRIKDDGYSIHYITENYWYKIYDKARQYGLLGEILRFEKRYIKNRPLKSLNYNLYSDLLKEELITKAKQTILKSFEKFIFYDNQIELSPKLPCSEKGFLGNIKKANYLEELPKDEFKLAMERYQSLLIEYSDRDMHAMLRKLVCKQLELCK